MAINRERIENATREMIAEVEREEREIGYVEHPIAGNVSAREYIKRKTIDQGAGALYWDVIDALDLGNLPAVFDEVCEIIDQTVTAAGYEVG